MRWNALCVAVLALMVSGCGLFKKKPEVQSGMDYSEPTMASNSYPVDPAPYTATSSAYPTSASGSRTHTVQKKETLYSLARSYYNDHSKWRTIYDANRSEIGEDPNRIRVGQKLVIP